MLRDREGIEPVLVDFGLAVHEDDEDYVYYQCGTPGYLAPEVLALVRGQKLSCKSDIFSAGAVLYFMLTSDVLFKHSNQEQIMLLNKICNTDHLNDNNLLSVLDKKFLKELLHIDPD